jgi:pimeloyl-ACP methyl ester carboxylesterase
MVVTESVYLSVNGQLAFIESAGTGRTVFCIHTAGQSGVQWQSTMMGLSANGYRVVVPDLPGHGRSEPAATGPVKDLAVYAEWCIDIMTALDLEQPYVLGCSIGGKIALEIASRIPDRLSGVVAMAASARPDGLLSPAAAARGMESAASPSTADRTYYGTLAACGGQVSAGRRHTIATMHRREDPAVTAADLVGWFTHNLTPALGRITCPVLLVVGTDDFWLDVAEVRRTAEQIRGARLLVLPGVGHYPMEELDDFSSVSQQWLHELDSSQR